MAEPRNTVKGPGGSRKYVWPPPPAKEELRVPSVTTILSGGMPKPALVRWAAKEAATYAVETLDYWRKIPQAEARIKHIAGAPFTKRDKKADIGTLVHEAIEKIAGGEDQELVLQMTSNEEVGYVYAALAFLDSFDVEVLGSEATVYSRDYGYAGTLDILAEVPGHGRCIVDFKTSKGIYLEHGVQLAAYAFADFMANGAEEVPMPRIETGIAVCLKPDGKFDAVPFTDLWDLFEAFLAAQTIYHWNKSSKLPKPLERQRTAG